MIASIIKRDGRVVPFNRDKIAFAVYSAAVAVGGRDRAAAEAVTDDVVRLLEARAAAGAAAGATTGTASTVAARSAAAAGAVTDSAAQVIPTVEDVQDLVEKALIEGGHARTAKAYIIYRYEHALKRAGRASLTYSRDNIPYKTLWETLAWAAAEGCTRLSDLTAAAGGERFSELIVAAEAFYHEQLDAAAAAIGACEPLPRVVIVAGPSSSGKTTTTLKLRERLEAAGMRLRALAVDNYFFDLELHPRDPRGDYDFETPQALDLQLLNRHLLQLLAGEQVMLPRYDFKTGQRHDAVTAARLEADEVLLIDSLHGLYPDMTAGVAAEHKFAVYVETLSQARGADGSFVRWTDVRMLRRMVRDAQFRNYDAWQTLLHWQYVRRAEMRHIISRLRSADAIINTYLAYELPVLKHRLWDDVQRFVAELGGEQSADADNDDARSRIVRVAELLEQVPSWSDEQQIPRDSLLREFIGGSSYDYE